jgi:hypothetical protein
MNDFELMVLAITTVVVFAMVIFMAYMVGGGVGDQSGPPCMDL